MNRKWRLYLGLITVAAIWGANFGVSRWAMQSFDPILFVFLRFGLALPFFFILLKLREGSIGIRWRDCGRVVITGILGVTMLEIAVMYSIKYTTLANASLLNVAPWPVFVALFGPFFLKESITTRLLAGGAAAMAGVVLIVLGGGGGFNLSSKLMLGNALALSVSIIGALFSLLSLSLMKRYSSLRICAWTILAGVIFLLPFTFGSWGKVNWTGLSFQTYIALIYNVLFCTVIAFVLWNACMNKIGATRSNFFRYAAPAAAVAVGYAMFQETIGLLQIIGAVVIVLGLVSISLEKLESAADAGSTVKT